MDTKTTTAPDGRTSRVARLKAATQEAHERLDERFLALDPFGDLERYRRFLAVQHAFHQEIDRLQRSPALAGLIPDMAARRRLDLIRQDMLDLGVALPEIGSGEERPVDVAGAFGWLYVAEGGNLSAATFMRSAAGLGLTGDAGARHLAAASQSRGAHWQTFLAALEELGLDEAAERRLVDGGIEAFDRYHALLATHLVPPR